MARHGTDKEVCGAQRANQPPGTLCQNVAGERTEHLGIGRCYLHGGRTATHNKAALNERLDREVRVMLGGDYEPITDPYTALADLAGKVVRVQEFLLEKVEELDDLRSYTTGQTNAEQIDVIFAAFERALDRTERTLSNMSRLDLDAKIAKLQARINRETADQITSALGVALDAAEITGEVREVVLSVFGSRLRGDFADSQPRPLSAAAEPA